MLAPFFLIICSASLSFGQIPLPSNKTCADVCAPIQVDPKDASFQKFLSLNIFKVWSIPDSVVRDLVLN